MSAENFPRLSAIELPSTLNAGRLVQGLLLKDGASVRTVRIRRADASSVMLLMRHRATATPLIWRDLTNSTCSTPLFPPGRTPAASAGTLRVSPS